MQQKLGTEGSLFDFSDDVYLMGQLDNGAKAMKVAFGLYAKVDLRIGWGPTKHELNFLEGCDPHVI